MFGGADGIMGGGVGSLFGGGNPKEQGSSAGNFLNSFTGGQSKDLMGNFTEAV